MKNIPITKSVMGDEECAGILKPLESGWLVQGPYVAEFEQLFRDYIGAPFTKAVSNCTTALHLSLDALGIGPGDKVVVPSFTYVASANAVTYTGAEVIFCDINLDTFNLDVNQLDQILQKEEGIKAVMPVHLFGLCAEMAAINKLANERDIHVIEDAACAFGSYIGKQHAGTFGDAGCFSFHPRKSITTGEGGMITTSNEVLYNNIKQLCDHGAAKSDLERHEGKGGSLLPDFTMRGYNYRMTDMQGALGVAQMNKADHIISKRKNIAKMYDEALKNSEFLSLPSVPETFIHSYQSYVCLFKEKENVDQLSMDEIDSLNIKRNEFMAALDTKGIATRQGTHAVHTLSYYRERYGLKDTDFMNAYIADRLSITLPLYADMTIDEFDYVLDNINKCK